MPWGPLDDELVAERALACAEAAAQFGADAIVMACNTASVLALDVVRERFEPRLPVVGTVPAIKPAAALGVPFAVWATPGTTRSAYQGRLVAEFASDIDVTPVSCPGLAEAIERADLSSIENAVADAACRTPSSCRAVVLGCTQYPLVENTILSHLPSECAVFHSALAVARRALQRLGIEQREEEAEAATAHAGLLTVLLSGRPGDLPREARSYEDGRALSELERPA
jgi:glutamate racemase